MRIIYFQNLMKWNNNLPVPTPVIRHTK